MADGDVVAIIVSYRSAELAVRCLASLQAERERLGGTVRAVLVDNASGDLPHIGRAVQERGWSSWVTLVLAPRNGGFSYGNNLGIRTAYEQGRPEFLLLLNPDTEVRAGAIAALRDFLRNHPEAGIAGSSFETEDGTDWPFAFRFPTLVSEFTHALQIGFVTRLLSRWNVAVPMQPVAQPVDWICGASMMIRPSVLAAIGGFDEEFFLYFEETEFCLRARRAGVRTWYVPASRVMHLIGKSTEVAEETRLQRRLPGYWFESRVRYFAIAGGAGYAALVDIAVLVGGAIGLLKARLLGRGATPHYLRDLLSHSPLLPGNRRLRAATVYFPPR